MKYTVDVKFGEKILTFHFGLSFLGYFYDKYDLDPFKLNESIKKNEYKWLPLTMFESYKHACKLNNKESEFTELQFSELIDENGGLSLDSSASEFFKPFIKSILVRLGLDENSEENKTDPKKK